MVVDVLLKCGDYETFASMYTALIFLNLRGWEICSFYLHFLSVESEIILGWKDPADLIENAVQI